ncbi:MAG: MBL fold metallo-hydrolase [Candidatus Bathyarchaeia archaeon]
MEITFHGGAREVGGSCVVVETEDARVALDYGIKVDQGISYDLPTDLDAVVVSHAHLDHSGNLLTMADRNTVIVGSDATRDITGELLRDLIKVQRMNGNSIPYDSHEVDRVKGLWLSRDRLALPGMEISLHPAGHVLGAEMVCIRAEGKTLIYTGDFCLHETEILDGADLSGLPSEADVLIMESTYGGVVRPERGELVKEFLGKVGEAMGRGGNVLIPTFAFHRTQEMTRRIDLAIRKGLLPSYNAYYISGLARRITRIFNEYRRLLRATVRGHKRPFSYKHVRRLRRTEDIKEPAVVICTSGFGHAGASRSLLFEWADDEDNTVIINSGYIPPDSPLSMAMDKGVIGDGGDPVPVRASVEHIELSGHADQHELIKFVRGTSPGRTFLMHGDLEQAEMLGGKIDRYTDVSIPEKHESFRI